MTVEDTALATVAVEDATTVKAPKTKKQNARKYQKAPVEESSPAKTNATAAGGKSRKYSAEEKLEKLKLIETQLADGASTLKGAVKSAGISEQTYYNWKGSTKPASQTATQPVPAVHEYAELVQLEAENERLRKLLSKKLRTENSDLRKKLGLY